MKTLYAALALTFVSTVLFAQNLVLNPSFENYSSCPVGPSEFENATNWTHPFINTIGDTCSTSDLFSTCSPFGALGVGVPDNVMGSEAAHTGNSYAGFIAYEGFTAFGCNSLFGSNWREYVQGELSAPLQAGQTYCVSFWISLADNVKWSTDDIGVYLSNSQLSYQCANVGNSVLPVTPQLENTTGDIDNVNGWVQLSWDYTASGGEQYIIIGNFKNDANTTYSCVNQSAFNPYSYYYIDDVSVAPGACTVPCALNVEIESTQEDCEEGGQATLTANVTGGSGNYSFNWGTAGTGQTVTVGDGSYTVVVSDNSNVACSETETITIDILDPVVAEAGPNDTICKGDIGQLIATGGVSYDWNNGMSGGTLNVGPGATTTFTVTVTGANGCTDTDEATIVVYDVPSVLVELADQTVCDNSGSITLVATPTGGTFTGNGVNGNTFNPSLAGIGEHVVYYSFGEYEDCLGTDSVVFTVDLCTGLNEVLNENTVHVYPNPTSGNFTVEVSTSNDVTGTIEVVDVLGQLVTTPIQKNLNGLRQTFDLSGLSKGIYILRISTESEKLNQRIHIE